MDYQISYEEAKMVTKGHYYEQWKRLHPKFSAQLDIFNCITHLILEDKIKRTVTAQLGDSDHKPVLLVINISGYHEQPIPLPSWNYKKSRLANVCKTKK
jgi:hypothetical protein